MEKFTHRCIIRSGDLEGNEHWQEADAYDYEFRNTCDNCGERLVTGRQLLAHIYSELLS